MRIFLFLVCLLSLPLQVHAQVQVDTVFTWQAYGRQGRCRVRVYKASPDDDRTHTVVLQELAENRGPTVTTDSRHLVELVGRAFGVDPATAHWVFHWGAFSFEDARPDARKQLFLRATFRRTKGGGLASPSWRVVDRDDLAAYTDRLFQ